MSLYTNLDGKELYYPWDLFSPVWNCSNPALSAKERGQSFWWDSALGVPSAAWTRLREAGEGVHHVSGGFPATCSFLTAGTERTSSDVEPLGLPASGELGVCTPRLGPGPVSVTSLFGLALDKRQLLVQIHAHAHICQRSLRPLSILMSLALNKCPPRADD